MRIGVISKGAVGAFLQAHTEEESDLLLFGFNGTGQVSYEQELEGKTNRFEEVALLSAKNKCVVVSGCITDTHGHKRKSAVVAENGRLLGVSDLIHVVDGGEGVGGGASLRVYETRVGRMGVVVGEDLRFPEVLHALTVCGADFVVCPFERSKEIDTVVLRALAYCYGTPVLFCANGYASVADAFGNLPFASFDSPSFFDFTIAREYHLISTRRKCTMA